MRSLALCERYLVLIEPEIIQLCIANSKKDNRIMSFESFSSNTMNYLIGIGEHSYCHAPFRAVGRSENPDGQVVILCTALRL